MVYYSKSERNLDTDMESLNIFPTTWAPDDKFILSFVGMTEAEAEKRAKAVGLEVRNITYIKSFYGRLDKHRLNIITNQQIVQKAFIG